MVKVVLDSEPLETTSGDEGIEMPMRVVEDNIEIWKQISHGLFAEIENNYLDFTSMLQAAPETE